MATTSCSIMSTSASVRGVRTLPGRVARSAVASYRRNVITLRARTRNCSGSVLRSRSPARLSATSGCLLTLSGTLVPSDEEADGVDGDLQHPVHVRGVEVVDLPRAQPVHAQVDCAGAQLAQPRDHEQGRGLHVVAEDARP